MQSSGRRSRITLFLSYVSPVRFLGAPLCGVGAPVAASRLSRSDSAFVDDLRACSCRRPRRSSLSMKPDSSSFEDRPLSRSTITRMLGISIERTGHSRSIACSPVDGGLGRRRRSALLFLVNSMLPTLRSILSAPASRAVRTCGWGVFRRCAGGRKSQNPAVDLETEHGSTTPNSSGPQPAVCRRTGRETGFAATVAAPAKTFRRL